MFLPASFFICYRNCWCSWWVLPRGKGTAPGALHTSRQGPSYGAGDGSCSRRHFSKGMPQGSGLSPAFLMSSLMTWGKQHVNDMEGERKREPCQGPGKVPGSSLAKLSRAGLCLLWAQASHWPGFVSKSRELGLSLGSLSWVCEGSFEASVGCSAPNPSFSAGPSCKYLNAGVAGPASLGGDLLAGRGAECV